MCFLTRIRLCELTTGAHSRYSANGPAGSGRIHANSSAKRFCRLALAARSTLTKNRSYSSNDAKSRLPRKIRCWLRRRFKCRFSDSTSPCSLGRATLIVMGVRS